MADDEDDRPGSVPLPNGKQEKFALLRARGQTMEDAYQMAGYAPDKRNAQHLERRVEVAQRIAYLRVKAAETAMAEPIIPLEKIIATRTYVLERLIENAEICMGKRPSKQAIVIRRKAKEPLIHTIEVTSHNPNAATKVLELLGKEVGLFVGAGAPPEDGGDGGSAMRKHLEKIDSLDPDTMRDMMARLMSPKDGTKGSA